MIFSRRKILSLTILMMGLFSFAHEGKKHSAHHPKPSVQEKSDLAQISEMYLSDVKPIFEKKCFDCHGSQGSSPWYRNMPIVKQLIDHDLQESKEHLDMTTDFPFKSHATPKEDLDAIQETIDKNEMPPFRYRIMHSNSALTGEEKGKVRKWIQFGKSLLKEKQNTKESP